MSKPSNKSARKSRTRAKQSRKPAAKPVPLSEGVMQPASSVDLGEMRDSIAFQLRYASWAVHAVAAAHFMPADAVPRQYSVLHLVGLNPGINVSSLATSIGVDQSTLVPTLNVLEDRGWILRHRGKPDRRVTTLELTRQGQSTLGAFSEMLKEHEEFVTAGLSRAERERFLKMLRRIRSNSLSVKEVAGRAGKK